MSTANKVILCCLCATFCSLLLLGRAIPVDAGVLFSDNFNRLDDATVGNGWTEVDESNLQSSIGSNALKMSQVGGLPASTEDTQDTRIYRFGSQHNNIVLSGTFNITMAGPGGASQTARVVVRSNGTEGSGFHTNTNTGAIDYSPCGGPNGLTPPDCWEGDGYGFAAFADSIDSAPGGWVQIVDDGTELAFTFFSFENGVTYQWEMQVNALNHVALFIWTGAKPSVPTLDFTNGGLPYTPFASGDNWQIEVRNTNDNLGTSHTHTATWDDFNVASMAVSPNLIVNGHVLKGQEEKWVRFVGKEIVSQLPGSRDEQILVAARASWWGLKEGVFALGNPHKHSVCNVLLPNGKSKDIRLKPLETCSPGRAWQVGLAGVQVPNFSDQEVSAVVSSLQPGRTENDILVEVVNLAKFNPGQGTGAAIVASTGVLKKSWLLRHPAVGLTLVERNVTAECIDPVTPPSYCYGTGWLQTRKYAPTPDAIQQSVSDLRDIFDELAP